MESENNIEEMGWYQLGILLGYPECCVRSMCNGRWGCFLSEQTISVLHSQKPNGFVPCPEHEAQIMAGVKVSTILGRRRNYSDKQIDALWDAHITSKEPA